MFQLTGYDTNGDDFGAITFTVEWPTADKYMYWGHTTTADATAWDATTFAESKHSNTPALAGTYVVPSFTGNAYIGFLYPNTWGQIATITIPGASINILSAFTRTASVVTIGSTTFDAYRITALQDGSSYSPFTYVLT